jgi:predicted transcriptional regulator
MTEKLRDKDRAVLKCIQEGIDDVQKITAETTLENHYVTYAFQKLEEPGLIQV